MRRRLPVTRNALWQGRAACRPPLADAGRSKRHTEDGVSPDVQLMVYRALVTKGQRIYLQQPAGLVADAAAAADFPLSSYLHAWLVSAVRVAEAAARAEIAGHPGLASDLDRQLPREADRRSQVREHDAAWLTHPKRPTPKPGEDPPSNRTRLALTVSAAERARWERALAARGSSVLACVTEALRAITAADGSWLDASMPGIPAPSWRGVGAA